MERATTMVSPSALRGLGDDSKYLTQMHVPTVHFQNTLALVRKLLRHSDKNYLMLIFPDSHHSMEYEGARSQLYSRIDQFFTEHLQLDVDTD